jgi:hypothetical protein
VLRDIRLHSISARQAGLLLRVERGRGRRPWNHFSTPGRNDSESIFRRLGVKNKCPHAWQRAGE